MGSQLFPATQASGRLSVARDGTAAFSTIRAAIAAARAGDCVIVYPGTYKENNLLKDRVNLFFMPGAVVDYDATNDDDGLGIFDDRNGAVTCTISGEGVFKFKDTLNDITQANANLFGLFYISQALTSISLKAKQLQATAWVSEGGCAVRVNNATRVDIEVDDISDPNFGQSILDVDGVTTWQSAGTGVIWAKGETYIKAHTILGSNYGLWAKGDNDGATDANLWMECDFLKSGPGSAAYWSGGVTANWRTWLKCQEIECVAVEGVSGAVNWLGGGRHYVEAQKITAPGNVFFVQGAGGFDPSVWLNAQKLSGGGSVAQKLLTVASGVLHATVMHFEDNGFAAGAINVTGGELNLTGGLAKILNGPGIIQSGGIARISGLRMDTANTNNVANVPVSVSSAGLTLRNCVLVAPALADSVKGDAARTITNYGSVANKAKNANVTVNVAALIVDANVV